MIDIHSDIRNKLIDLSEPKYRDFSMKLIPGCECMLGVRLPILRRLAKEIVHTGQWKDYVEDIDKPYIEEILIQGMILGFINVPFDEWTSMIDRQVTRVTNWSTCDTFVSSLKQTNRCRGEMWQHLQRYLVSTRAYDLRFSAIMLMAYFIVPEYIDRVLELLNKIHHEEYYVKMGVAWALSVCYVKFPNKTMQLFRHNELDDFTYNKALQKICESFRVSKEDKIVIKAMKRK